jgi:hypothetical protein
VAIPRTMIYRRGWTAFGGDGGLLVMVFGFLRNHD